MEKFLVKFTSLFVTDDEIQEGLETNQYELDLPSKKVIDIVDNHRPIADIEMIQVDENNTPTRQIKRNDD